jgi:hypothetical protein
MICGKIEHVEQIVYSEKERKKTKEMISWDVFSVS